MLIFESSTRAKPCDAICLWGDVGVSPLFFQMHLYVRQYKFSFLRVVGMYAVFAFVMSTNSVFCACLGWSQYFLLSFCNVNSLRLLRNWDEFCLSFNDVNQLSVLSVVGVNWIFPFVMWNNSVFWAWLEWIHSFLLSLFLRCEILVVLFAVPVSKPGWGEFSFFCCNVNESCASC